MGLYPDNLNDFVASMGIPRGPKSKAYVYDPVNGSNSNTGVSWESPLLTLEAAEDKCVGDQHDVVLAIAGDTADNPSAMVAWDKDYTHLIGLSSGVYGLGQRCRVVALAATALTAPITFSSNGCIVKNMQFNNELATGTAGGCGIITGQRNYFENVFFMAPTTSTAASYSMKSAGAENVFKHCTFGQTTNARSAATYSLWLHKGAGASVCREIYDECLFLSWGALHSHVHVLVDNDIATVPWWVAFKDCLFFNASGGGDTLQQSIDDNSTAAGHAVLLWGKNSFAGVDAVADTLTYVLNQSKFAGGLMAALSES
jgi:hypothetical protein